MPDIPHITIWGKCHSTSDFEQEWGIPGSPPPTLIPHLFMLFFQTLAIFCLCSHFFFGEEVMC